MLETIEETLPGDLNESTINAWSKALDIVICVMKEEAAETYC